MLWIFTGLGTALAEALKDAASKKAMTHLPSPVVTWTNHLVALPFLYLVTIGTPVPALDATFWGVLLVTGLLHCGVTLLYFRTISQSPLSLTLPMLTFTPVFMLFTAPLIIGEVPSKMGAAALLLIVGGAYLLNLREIHRGVLAPIRALVHDRGPRQMLLVAFVWSITGTLDRIGIVHSERHHWMFSIWLSVTAYLTVAVVWQYRGRLLSYARHFPRAIVPGFLNGVSFLLYIETIALTQVSYAVALKRVSIVIAVLIGYFYFGERNLRDRLAGAIAMVAGVALLAFA